MATTLAPCRANSSVQASPMPEVPPVIEDDFVFQDDSCVHTPLSLLDIRRYICKRPCCRSYPLNPDRARRWRPERRNSTARSIRLRMSYCGR